MRVLVWLCRFTAQMSLLCAMKFSATQMSLYVPWNFQPLKQAFTFMCHEIFHRSNEPSLSCALKFSATQMSLRVPWISAAQMSLHFQVPWNFPPLKWAFTFKCQEIFHRSNELSLLCAVKFSATQMSLHFYVPWNFQLLRWAFTFMCSEWFGINILFNSILVISEKMGEHEGLGSVAMKHHLGLGSRPRDLKSGALTHWPLQSNI